MFREKVLRLLASSFLITLLISTPRMAVNANDAKSIVNNQKGSQKILPAKKNINKNTKEANAAQHYIINEIIMSIDGIPITSKDIIDFASMHKSIIETARSIEKDKTKASIEPLLSLAVDSFITDTVISLELKKLDIDIDEAEVDRMYNKIIESEVAVNIKKKERFTKLMRKQVEGHVKFSKFQSVIHQGIQINQEEVEKLLALYNAPEDGYNELKEKVIAFIKEVNFHDYYFKHVTKNYYVEAIRDKIQI